MTSNSAINILTKVVKIFLIGVLLLLLLGTVLLFGFSHEELTTCLLSLYGKSDKLISFQTIYFTPASYHLLQGLCGVALLAALVGLYRWKSFVAWATEHVHAVYTSLVVVAGKCRRSWGTLSRQEQLTVCFFLTGIAVIKLFCLPLFFFHTDEIFSYLHLVERGVPVVASYYPGPNNHIFYLLLVCVFKPFVQDPFFLMKLPAWGISILVSATFFLCLKKYFRFSLALLGMLLLSLAPSVFLYSVFGRGYILMLFFALLSFFAALEIITQRATRTYWHIYVLVGILGGYTLLTYVYPLVALAVVFVLLFIYEKRYTELKNFFYYHILLSIGLLILYLPVLVFSGLESITANPWVQKMSWNEAWTGFPELLAHALAYISNAGSVGVGVSVLLLGGAMYSLFGSGRKKEAFLLLAFVLVPFVVVLLQRVKPFDRVWMYLVFPFCICLLILLEKMLRQTGWRLAIKYTAVVYVCILSAAGVYYYRMATASHGIYDAIDRITSVIVEEGATRVYTNDDTYNSYLRYHYHRRGSEVVPVVGALPSDDRYDYLLLLPGTVFPEGAKKEKYKLVERNEFIEVYKLK